MTTSQPARLDRIETLLEQTAQRVDSNSRAIQAILDAMVSEREQRAELRAATARTEEAIARITTLNEGVVNLLTSLDEDRPTVLRKLNDLERKVDRLLEEREW
jgi:chromosome segregation ATPase